MLLPRYCVLVSVLAPLEGAFSLQSDHRPVFWAGGFVVGAFVGAVVGLGVIRTVGAGVGSGVGVTNEARFSLIRISYNAA